MSKSHTRNTEDKQPDMQEYRLRFYLYKVQTQAKTNVWLEVRRGALWWERGRKKLQGTMRGASGVLAMFSSLVWVLVARASNMGV